MGGEHLQIANYDSLSEEEILAKLDIISDGAGVNVPAFKEYEAANENRSAIIEKLDELEAPSDVDSGEQQSPTEDVEPQAVTPGFPPQQPTDEDANEDEDDESTSPEERSS